MSTSLGTSYRQSVPSPSSQYLAFITEDAKDLAIINTSPSPPPYGRLCRRIKLQDPRFAARVATIRWTPQSSTTDDGILDEGSLPLSSESIQSALATSPRILLSDGRHIQVYTTLDPGSYRTGSQKLHSLIYNIDLGTTFGKTTHVDFLLNHHHIIALTETNVHATILTIDGELGGPKYIELKPAPKSGLPVPNILTLHPKSKNHFSILGKASDGKDVVSTYRYSYNEVEPWSVEVRNVLSTYDAQGFCWSPDGRFVAVWDTPSMGCNVRFYTGDGLELEHMCIDKIMPGYGISEPQDGIEGLGVKSLNWFSKDQILGITDFDGNVVLRKLDEGYRWRIISVHAHTDQVNESSTTIFQEPSPSATITTTSTFDSNHNPQPHIHHLRPFPLPTNTPSSTTTTTTTTTNSSNTSSSSIPSPPRSITRLLPSPSSSLLATTSSLTPSVVWVWQIGIGAPLVVLSFKEGIVREMEWYDNHTPDQNHEGESDDLLMILTSPSSSTTTRTSSTKSRVHIWSSRGFGGNENEVISWTIGLPSSSLHPTTMTTGKFEIKWLPYPYQSSSSSQSVSQSLSPRTPLFLLTTPQSYDIGYLLCSNPSKSTSNSQINFHSTLFTDTRTEAKATSPSFPESNPKSQAIESDNENKNENYDQEIETETEIEINTPTHAPLKRVRAMRSGKGNENVKEKTRTENAKTNSNSENRTGSEKKQKTPKSKREVTR